MRNIYFGDFRILVINHIREVEADNPGTHTVEWFLLKYLRRIVKHAEGPADPGRIEGSVRSLIRFYLDNIDENSDLGEKCLMIHEAYRKTLRQAQEQDV